MENFKLKGYYSTHHIGCMVSVEPKIIPVISTDSFATLDEAKQEWMKDPWLEGEGKCILATEIIEVKNHD
ncbi:hypothetical protein [Lactococcus protaetiae]|uniref:Uncharacterized protein n=1 Tax=Lactococcus protaetiae TaxID=2592653 RepID=A0A514Z6V4_9LACT|nr:hypothetical protein [Lactococcus protaetiae]QDK70322.1 hypothetical protein FLP15_03000 [Lactococcus protaetiae]